MPCFIPHPTIVWEQVRPNDIWIVLAIGGGYEFVARFLLLFFVKRKSKSLRDKEILLQKVTYQTHQRRNLGPSAFVETAKLERQMLALEKELDEIYKVRSKSKVTYEKLLLKTCQYLLLLVVFICYFGVPLATLGDPYPTMEEQEENALTASLTAENSWKMMFFPLSYIGMGVKISKWGMEKDVAACSVSALMVFWSAQVFMEKIMDAVDAYVLS